MEVGKYITLWKKWLPVIRIQLKKSLNEGQQIKLNKTEFEVAGDRDSSGYRFNLEIDKGKVTNDISGTAVARDLYQVLNDESTMKEFFNAKKIKINMGKDFVLKLKVASV